MNTQKGVEENKGHGEDQRPCSFPINIIIHRERCDFAKAHEHWTVEDWKRVIWSDERKWVWKKKGDLVGNTQIWRWTCDPVGLGCFGWDCKIDGNMDADLYVSILEDELQESLNYWGKNPQGVVFQQDNDPNPLISIPLSIYGITSRGSLESMRSHLEGFRSCGREFRRSGTTLGWRSVGN